MKHTLFFISIFNILLFGCMKSQISDSLTTKFHGYKPTTITILSNNLEDKNLAKCLQRELKEDLPNLKVIPEDQFRNALFPWFEYRTAPKDATELSALLEKTLVRKHIEKLGVEILVYVHGVTIRSQLDGPGFCGGGYGGAGCLGYLSAERETYLATTVLNLTDATTIGSTDVRFHGKLRMPMLIIPIPIPAFTQGAACSETAKLISDCLKNKDPSRKND
jgi:hypothetical protein